MLMMLIPVLPECLAGFLRGPQGPALHGKLRLGDGEGLPLPVRFLLFCSAGISPTLQHVVLASRTCPKCGKGFVIENDKASVSPHSCCVDWIVSAIA
jgi:hypothetical protein